MRHEAAPTSPGSERWVRIRRELDAPPDRVFRAWSQPEELARWFPFRVEGSLTVGTRTTLAWPDQRVWWDVIAAEPNVRFAFRWPWLADESHVTTVTLRLEPRGYGTTAELEDGPFDTTDERLLGAWGEAREGWAEAMTMLRAVLDFSVDVRRPR
jgi:uncharacterized protein YndB with AHSA1/START domain